MKQQTAVEWLIKELANSGLLITKDIDNLVAYIKAKQMEKEQMIKFAFDFYYDYSTKVNVPINLITDNRINAEQYYNETYK